jgi:hypothetical protein
LADITLIRLHASRADSDLVAEAKGYFPYYVAKFFHPFHSLAGVYPSISPDVVRSRRVPSLGGYAETRGRTILLVGCFSGMVFGAIHCVGWDFPFQSHAEQALWRASSLVMLCSPISFLVTYIFENDLFVFITISYIFAYIAARLTLIVLVLLSFQSLPLGVHDTVAWTKFIPHL